MCSGVLIANFELSEHIFVVFRFSFFLQLCLPISTSFPNVNNFIHFSIGHLFALIMNSHCGMQCANIHTTSQVIHYETY